MDKQKFIIFLRGLPGSGKTTFCNEVLSVINSDIQVISKDNYRIKNGTYFFDKNKENEIQEKYDKQLKNVVEANVRYIISDNLNLNDKNLKKDIGIAKEYKSISVNFPAKEIDYHVEKNTKGIGENDIRIFKKVYSEYSEIADFNIIPTINDLLNVLNGNTRTSKATDIESEKRKNIIYEMVVKGATINYIVRYCSENFGIGKRQTEKYLTKVYDEIKETYNDDYKKSLLDKHVAQLEDLYVKNYTIEDFRECRNIIESKNKMLGLNAPDKIDTTITEITPIFPDNGLAE